MSDYRQRVLKLLNEYLTILDKREKSDMLYMAAKWDVVVKNLEDLIDKLIALAEPTRNQLYQAELFQQFLVVAKQEMNQFAIAAGEKIALTQVMNIDSAIIMTSEMLGVQLGSLPAQAVINMIGMTKKETPLYELLQAGYPDVITNLTDTLIKGVSLGKNPVTIARAMKDNMNGNLSRAITICRTEELNAFRDANLEAMKNSGMVEGWEWISEPDACEDCLANDGKQFPLDEPFDSHPNCRCAELPVL